MVREAFISILRKSGYKATRSRLAVLAVFERNKSPLSTQAILEKLPRGIDQATVYRTIKSFKEKGIIAQIDLRHNHAHYELASLKKHHHVVCLRCGRLEDVYRCDAEAIQSAVLKSSRHFAEIKEHALEFYGVCKSCAAAAARHA